MPPGAATSRGWRWLAVAAAKSQSSASPRLCAVRNHSYRIASSGLSPAARRAGIQQANAETASQHRGRRPQKPQDRADSPQTTGSKHNFRSPGRPARRPRAPRTPASCPAAAPGRARFPAALPAPCECRFPCAAARPYSETTPYVPNAASASAAMANRSTSLIWNRRRATDSDMICSRVRSSGTGTSPSTLQTAARRAAAMRFRIHRRCAPEWTTNFAAAATTGCTACPPDFDRGSCSARRRPRRRPRETLRRPSACGPTASPFGQSLRARLWEMMATRWLRSAASKSRPARRGMCRVPKYPGLIKRRLAVGSCASGARRFPFSRYRSSSRLATANRTKSPPTRRRAARAPDRGTVSKKRAHVGVLRVLRSGQGDIDGENAFDIEAPRDGRQADETREEQARGNQQCGAQTDFERHQKISQTQSRWSAGVRITGGFQRLVWRSRSMRCAEPAECRTAAR